MSKLRLGSIALIGSLCLSLTAGAAPKIPAGNWTPVEVKSAEKVVVVSKGEDQNYWKLLPGKNISLRVEGAGHLKVISRAIFPVRTKNLAYQILGTRDGNKKLIQNDTTGLSKVSVRYAGVTEHLGKPISKILKIPHGTHEYKFFLPDEAIEGVYLRFMIAGDTALVSDYVACLPRSFSDEVQINVKDQDYIYYRAHNSSPIELEVTGPTHIKCVARLEYLSSGHTPKQFHVQVTEGSNTVLTLPFTARISGNAKYSEANDNVISTGNSFFIDIPAGKHIYKVNTIDPGFSVLFRFYLPQNGIGNVLQPNNGKKRVGMSEPTNGTQKG
jgi:hypothetical protein